MRQLRRLGFELEQGGQRLITQRRRQRGNPIEEILALLLPTGLHHLIVFCVQHPGQIVRGVVVEIEPGFGIGAPGVLGLKKDVAQQSHIGSVAGMKFLLREPGLAKPRNLTVPGKLKRITRNTVDPRIPNLLLHAWQVAPVRLDGIRDLTEVGGDNPGIGELAVQIVADLKDLCRLVGAAVVPSHHDPEPGTRATAPYS